MSRAIVVLNGGSSSLKFLLFVARDGLESPCAAGLKKSNGSPLRREAAQRSAGGREILGLAMTARSIICSRSYVSSSPRTTW